MKFSRVLGIIVIIAGIAMFFIANYINAQVSEGKGKIASAQQKVNQGSGLFSLNPVSKEVGKHVTDAAQKKINEGQQMIQHYEGVAGMFQTGGLIAVVVGVGIFIFSFVGSKGKKSRR